MKEINLQDYYPFYTKDTVVEVPDEVALLLREYALLEEAYRIRTYRYQAFYSLEGHKGIEREALKHQPSPDEILEQRQTSELIFRGLAILSEKQRHRIYSHFFLGMSKADIATEAGPPQLKYCHNCHAPRLLLDNRIYTVIDTSFCVPSGRWGGAATGSLRR